MSLTFAHPQLMRYMELYLPNTFKNMDGAQDKHGGDNGDIQRLYSLAHLSITRALEAFVSQPQILGVAARPNKCEMLRVRRRCRTRPITVRLPGGAGHCRRDAERLQRWRLR